MIDTHAHIYSENFDEDRELTIQRAKEVGVEKILMPNIDHTSIDAMLECEMKYEGTCIPMMGLHPCYVKQDFEKELYIVEDWLNKREFIAVGEIGIDLYWDKTYQQQQIEAFKIQINWAKERNVPIVIHARDSTTEVLEVLSQEKDEKLRGIFHCFGGSLEEAQQIIELDFHLGIGGVSTFKKGGLDKVLPEITLEHLVLETDCPYLAPVPHRGKRNEPAYIDLVADRISDLKEISKDEVIQATTENAKKVFGLDS